MKGMRLLPALLSLLLIGSVCAVGLQKCFASHSEVEHEDKVNDTLCFEEEYDDDTDTASSYVDVPIPDFVSRLLNNADWWADTVCVVNGTAYYLAYEGYCRTCVLLNKDRVLLAAPMVQIDSFASGCDTKFYVSNAAKRVLVDFSDEKTLEKLKSLGATLPSFTRYRKDTVAEFGRTVFYSFAADFPEASVIHSDAIRQWLVKLIERSQALDEDLPYVTTISLKYSKRPYGGWAYKGNVNDNEKIARFQHAGLPQYGEAFPVAEPDGRTCRSSAK